MGSMETYVSNGTRGNLRPKRVPWKPTSQMGSVETYVPNGFRGNLRPKRVPWKPTSQMGSVETYIPNGFRRNLLSNMYIYCSWPRHGGGIHRRQLDIIYNI